MTAEDLKKSILQQAIQGKLVPQNPDDEPASVLLARIRAEKARLVAEGKIKRDKNESVIYRNPDGQYIERIGKTETDITDQIPYELPDSWQFIRLYTICWLEDGLKTSGIKLPLMDANYHRGRGEVTYVEKGKMVEPNTKAILVDGENSGEVFSITEKGYLGSTFKKLGIVENVSEEWLHLVLKHFQTYFKGSKVGAAIPHLNKNLFRNLIIGLPPLAEQERIVERINQIFSLYQNSI